MATLASMTGLIRRAPLFEIYREELRALGVDVEVTYGRIGLSPSSAGVLQEVFLKTRNQSTSFGPKQIEFPAIKDWAVERGDLLPLRKRRLQVCRIF